MNPMVDGWRGDDWFHNGAFRQQGMSYIYDQEATRANDVKWWTSHFDDYDMFMQAGSGGESRSCRGPGHGGLLAKALDGPSYAALSGAQVGGHLACASTLERAGNRMSRPSGPVR